MENKIQLQINKKVISLEYQQFYTIKTSIECSEEFLLRNSNLNQDDTVIINSFSKYYNAILVPKYFKNNLKLLKKNGFTYSYGVVNNDCFKILIDNEKQKYSNIFVNTIGLDYDNIIKLKHYLVDLKDTDSKTIFFVNYNSNYKTNFEIYDQFDNLIYFTL